MIFPLQRVAQKCQSLPVASARFQRSQRVIKYEVETEVCAVCEKLAFAPDKLFCKTRRKSD